jgi:HAMP domain-containing protein
MSQRVEIASKIRNRVWSASAFEILSICLLFIAVSLLEKLGAAAA